MNYFEKNMECMAKSKRYLFNKIEEANLEDTSNRLDDIDSLPTRTKEKALVLTFHGETYRLNSRFSPEDEARIWAEQFSFHNLDNIVSMFGFGNGIFARTMMKRMGARDTLLICEPCADLFFYVLNNFDITDILEDNRVSITIEKINEFEFHNLILSKMNITNMKEQIMCVHPQYDKIFIESSLIFWKEIKDAYQHTKVNINTEIYFGERFVSNILNNLRFVPESNTIYDLREVMPKEVPAILVAAGPSVEGQLEALRKAKGKAVIFAVDRILDFLLDADIVPDFVVTIDPMKQLEHFSKREEVTVPLICFVEANYEILKRHKGRKIFCNCSAFLVKLYGSLKKIPPLISPSASVATVTFAVCAEMGFKKIILVGQDLAYDGEKSHSGKSQDDIYGTSRDAMLEDIHGNQIRSRFDWKEFVTWYQDYLLIHPEIEAIDAKDRGAKIKGALVMSLKDAIAKYCDKDVCMEQNIDGMEPTFDERNLKKIKAFLDHNYRMIDKVITKSETAVRLCEKLIIGCKQDKLGLKTYQKYIDRLRKINQYIQKENVYFLIDSLLTAIVTDHLLEMYHFTEDEKENNLITYEKSRVLFQKIIEVAEYIKPMLMKAVNSVS